MKARKTIHYLLLMLLVFALAGPLMADSPGVFRVTSIDDGGLGSLREAVSGALSGDTILFDASLEGETLFLTDGPMGNGTGSFIAVLLNIATEPRGGKGRCFGFQSRAVFQHSRFD